MFVGDSKSERFVVQVVDSVSDNTVADSTWALPYYVDDYHLPSVNMSIRRNIIWNVSAPLRHNTSQGIPVRGSTRCDSSTNLSAAGVTNCASFYSPPAMQPNAYGSGMNFANATLRQQLQYGASVEYGIF